jgi:GntR family transcriptional repressor for pyruvate dehydrogenase complex
MKRKSSGHLKRPNVLEHLQEMISNGKMPPETKIPSERMLAMELGVGRQAVREAIKALQVLDVIEKRHGDGTYVKSLAGLSGGWPSKVDLIREDFDPIQLLEVRQMFEPKAATLAASRRDK